MRRSSIVLWLVCLLFLTGCPGASQRGRLISKKASAEMPDLVAVLPPGNNTNDVTAVNKLRDKAAEMLISRGYFALSNLAMEESWRKLGLTDGGQLAAFRSEDLCKAVGSDGLL